MGISGQQPLQHLSTVGQLDGLVSIGYVAFHDLIFDPVDIATIGIAPGAIFLP